MWKSECKFLDSDRIYRVSIFKSDRRITYSEVIELWQTDRNFRTFFISLLKESPYEAYFWETPPITTSTCDRAFEFAIVNSPELAQVRANSPSFNQYFQSTTEEIVTFPNLSQDALLVVPCPIASISTYTHIASFVRNAPKSQQHLLWQTVGKAILQKLSQQPIWVNTSGLGVYWLHVRLDSFPKYYCFKPYKQSLGS